MVNFMKIEIDKEAAEELERWSKYIRANITDDHIISAVRRGRKALCNALNKPYRVSDEIQ